MTEFMWTELDVDRLQFGAKVTWFDGTEAGQIEVHRLYPQVGIGNPRAPIREIIDRWGGRVSLTKCDPSTIVDAPKPRRHEEAVVLIPTPEASDDGKRLGWKFINDAVDKRQEKMSKDKTLAYRILEVRDQVDVLLPGATALYTELDDLQRQVARLEDELWKHKPAVSFTWSDEDKKRLVKGAQLSWQVKQYTGTGTLAYVAYVNGEQEAHFNDGTWVPLSACDPSKVIDSPQYLAERKKLDRQAAMDRLSMLFASTEPDFSVVSEEDKAAWKLLKDELSQG